MKILHFADFHLGVDVNGPLDPTTKLNGRVLDYLDTFDALVEFAEEERVDIALFAGDAFHKPNPDPTYVREFAERVVRLSKVCPIVMIPGNHDMPGVVEKASTIDIFAVVDVPNVIIGWQPELHRIQTKSGVIQVATFPYPMKQQWLTTADKKEPGKVWRQRISEAIRDLGEQVDRDAPSVFLGHFGVKGCTYGIEQNWIMGDEAEVQLEDLLEPWDYVALGHIHGHQVLNDNPPVIYSGSLDRVDFGEEHQDKGFVLATIEGPVSWEFIQVDARPYRTIRVELPSGVKNPTAKVLAALGKENLERAIVRVELSVDEADAMKIRQDDVMVALKESGIFFIHSLVIKRRLSSNEIRLGNSESVAAMTQMELLGTYLNDNPNKKRLLKIAADIMSEEA